MPSSSSKDLALPGGGRIIFTASDASGQIVSLSGDMGVVDAQGSVRRLSQVFGDPVRDPLHSGGVLVVPSSFGGAFPFFGGERDRWIRVGRWDVGPGYNARISPDGRWVAYKVFRRGRETPLVQAARRGSGVRATFPLAAVTPGSWEPISWASTGRVIVARQGGDLFVWDVGTGVVRLFLGSSELSEALPGASNISLSDGWGLSWSTDRRYFAVSMDWRQDGRQHSGIMIGSASGAILGVIPTRGSSLIPTWSPARAELAWVETASGDRPARLYGFDMTTGQRRLVASGVPSAWWPAWSPHGDWLLVAPFEGTWLFVSRDGERRLSYPSLGAFPRWASPGTDIQMPVC
jgi:hypothetical protein